MSVLYLFPYSEVKSNSKIVIYAYGIVGKNYAEQIRQSNYCDIVAIIDKEFKNKECRNFRLCGLDFFGQNIEYDNVIIAIDDKKIRNIVYNDLITCGVKEEKIINTEPLNVHIESDYVLKTDLSNIEKIIDDFSVNANGSTKYLKSSIENIKKYDNKLELRDRAVQYIIDSDDCEKNIIILRLLYEAELFDKYLMKLFMDNILGLNDFDTMTEMFLDTTFMTFYHPKYLYDEFYLNRREILRKISNRFKIVKKPKINNNCKKKMAIVADVLKDEKLSVTQVIREYSKLCDTEYEVCIFTIDATYGNTSSILNPIFKTIYKSQSYYEYHKKSFNPNINIVYSRGISAQQRFQNVLDDITGYNPDCIIDMSDETNVLSYILYKHFPILYIPMRGRTSSIYCTKFLTRNKQMCLQVNEKYKSIRENQIIDKFFCGVPAKAEKEFSRKEYNFNENDFILITVGNRLKFDLSIDFIDFMAKLLYENFDIKWILVGEDVNNYIYKYEDLIKNKQIILWGYESDVCGLYKICNLYVNPNRGGGGTTIRWAMQMGIPVIMNKYDSDGLENIGLENGIDGGYKELIDYIEKLYKDESLYKNEVSRVVQYWKCNTMQSDKEKLMSAVEETIDGFKKEKINEYY